MTRTRKTLLLASMALIALAFAVPASASAYATWTFKGAAIKKGAVKKQSYVGSMGWTYSGTGGGFTCYETTVEIEAGGSSGKISRLERNPSSCFSTGTYQQYNCELVAQSDNIANVWNINIAAEILAVTTPGGPGTYLNTTEEYNCPGVGWNPTYSKIFQELTISPTLDELGRITSFIVNGWENSGAIYHQWGPFKPTTPELGLK